MHGERDSENLLCASMSDINAKFTLSLRTLFTFMTVLVLCVLIVLLIHGQVNGLFYDAMLEGVHFLLALLATQNTALFRGSRPHHRDACWPPFKTSAEEDTGRSLALAQRKEAYEAAVRAQAYSRQQTLQKQQQQQQQQPELSQHKGRAPVAAASTAAAAPEAAAPFLGGWFGFGGSTNGVAAAAAVAEAPGASTETTVVGTAALGESGGAALPTPVGENSVESVPASAPPRPLPPQPTLPPRTHYGLELVLCGSRNSSSEEGAREQMVRREAQAARLVGAFTCPFVLCFSTQGIAFDTTEYRRLRRMTYEGPRYSNLGVL